MIDNLREYKTHVGDKLNWLKGQNYITIIYRREEKDGQES